MPERFDLSYTGADNAEHRPVMIHRALLGSMERFAGILIEHHGGRLPLWLAPVQALVLPVADRHNEFAAQVAARAARGGRAGAAWTSARSRSDARSATRSWPRCPSCSCSGTSEQESGKLAVRSHDGGDMGEMSAAELAERIRSERSTAMPEPRGRVPILAPNAGHPNHAAPLSAPCPPSRSTLSLISLDALPHA